MSRTVKHLLQIQLSDEEKRRIKALAARQGMTFRQAVLAAFAVWEEMLSAEASSTKESRRPPDLQPSNLPHCEDEPTTPKPTTKPTNWLQRAAKLDWTKCREVEILTGKDRRFWVLRGSVAPLAEVLQSVAAGHPVEEIAEVFQLDLPQLTNVLQFAGAIT